MHRHLFLASLLLLNLGAAKAGVDALNGAIQSIAPPFSVQENAAESSFAGIFAERQNLVLSAPLAVNVSTSGVFNELVDLTPAAIPSGTRVNSYFVHADTSSFSVLAGEIVFGEPILGIILGESEQQAAHAVVGLPTVAYPANGSVDATRAALDFGNDELTVNLGTRTVRFSVAWNQSNAPTYEQFRVITAAAAVPEPLAVVLGMGGLGLLAVRRRFWCRPA